MEMRATRDWRVSHNSPAGSVGLLATLERIEELPRAPFHPTTAQSVVIRFRLRLAIAYSLLPGCDARASP